MRGPLLGADNCNGLALQLREMPPLLNAAHVALYSHSPEDRFPVEFARWVAEDAALGGLHSPAAVLSVSVGLHAEGEGHAYAVMRELISSWAQLAVGAPPALLFDLIGRGAGCGVLCAATESILADIPRGRIAPSVRPRFNLVLVDESGVESTRLAGAENLRLLAMQSTPQIYGVVAEFLFGRSSRERLHALPRRLRHREQHFHGPAFIHRGVALGDPVERQGQVEDW